LSTARLGRTLGGAAIIQVSRLLDYTALRGVIEDHRDVNLAILVSDLLYSYVIGYVIGAGHLGIPAKDFRRVRAIARNNFEEAAWLWCARVKLDDDWLKYQRISVAK
jgi:hypothetical protein